MKQVLFEIPIKIGGLNGIPIYGFGTMLVIALFLATWLAMRRAQKEGIARERIQDMALWVVICAIAGARIVYMIQYQRPATEFFKLWQGGLVFYGSLIGGTIGLFLAYYFVLRQYNLSWAKLADVIAPSLAVGLAIGRIGCLLNGCCYGEVACPGCASMGFPLSAPARYQLVDRGLQTTAGFSTARDSFQSVVDRVVPGSPAEQAGLRAGDRIVEVDGMPNQVVLSISGNSAALDGLEKDLTRHGRGTPMFEDGGRVLRVYYPNDQACRADRDEEKLEVRRELQTRRDDVLTEHLSGQQWPRGKRDLLLTVARDGQDVVLPAFVPYTLGLHPTQLYETISMVLLFLVLMSYYPFRRIDGQVMGLFLCLYAVHRFLNELLRNDTDPVAFGMTLSQNGSILVLLCGLILFNRDRVARAMVPVRRVLLGR